MKFAYINSCRGTQNALRAEFDALFGLPEVKNMLKQVAIESRITAEQRRRDSLVAAEVAAKRVSV